MMGRIQKKCKGLVVGIIAMSLLFPTVIWAYSYGPHDYIVRHAATIFSFPEMNQYLEAIVHGARDEDDTDHIYDYEVVTGTHFWDADAGNYVISYVTDLDYEYENAFQKAGELLNRSLLEYSAGNKYQAYEYLGHVVHLIADMTVPAHVHLDSHVLDEPYEDWLSDMETYPWDASHAVAAGGLITIPDSARQTVWSWPRTEQPLINLPVGVDLFYLMYTANQYADYFASDEVSGDSDDRLGWMDYTGWPAKPREYTDIHDNSTVWVCPMWPCPPNPIIAVDNDNDDDGDLSTIGNYVFPYAIRATATMFKSYRDEFDSVPPITTLILEGDAGSRGWFKGDVVMKLSAQDLDQWGNEGTVDVTQWNYSNGTGWHTYADPVFFTSEGIREVKYRSSDIMGNEEVPQTGAIKIDKTLPVITVNSPSNNGFYLTSGTLTIDFETFDAISGIDRGLAKIDETTVYDDQTIDLSTWGGHHTFWVTIADNAGNQNEISVDFSVKVAADVDFKPDILNLKTGSDVITAYIEFPSAYDITLISIPTVRLVVNGWMLSASLSPIELADYDSDGKPDLKVQFSRKDLVKALNGSTGSITLAVAGEMVNTTEFYGTEAVLVTNPPK